MQTRTLWHNFRDSFKKNVQSFSKIEIERLNIYSDRKYFLKEVFPKVSADLGLVFEATEFLRVDYTLFKKGSAHQWKVPQVFIESENSWESSYEEAIKLCSLNAPLKILFLYGYTAELKAEVDGGETNWDYIFEDFVRESRLIGLFVLVVYTGQGDGSLKFTTVTYHEDGKTRDTEEFEVIPK